MERARDVRELLDGPVPTADFAATLVDIERLNAWFGGYALTLGGVRRLAAQLPRGRAMLMLDVGGGAAGFAARAVRWARRAGRPLRVIVLDHDPRALAVAAAAHGGGPEVLLVRADATALPFRSGAVDVATCTLTLHHLEPDQAVRGLREMASVARLGAVVNDLLRTRLSLALVWLATRLVTRHPITRHDGPLSVRRAYSRDELRVLAEKAGVELRAVRRYPWLGRLVAVVA